MSDQTELDVFGRRFARAIMRPSDGVYAVYRNNWLNAVVEALGSNYPVIGALVGPAMFAAVAVDYATDHPPDTPVLALYGREFPDWLEEQGWVRELPYLADVARFERMHVESLFAADAPAIDMVDLSAGRDHDWFECRLTLHPAVRLGWATTPAMAIWMAHQIRSTGEISVDWKAGGGLFTRPGLTVNATYLDGAAHRILFGLRIGESVGAAASAAHVLYPDADVGAIFAALVQQGAFVSRVAN